MTLKSSLMFAKSLVFPASDKKSSARRSLIGALLCIGLSLVPLIVVICLTNGMIAGMTERIIGLSSSHLQAYIAPNYEKVQNAHEFYKYAESFKTIDGILNAYPQIEISALVSGKTSRTGGEIRAVQTDIFYENKSFKELFNVIEGSLDDFEKVDSKAKHAVVGQKLAETLKLSCGDTFRVISTKTVNGKIAPKMASFTVCAIVSSGYQELDALWVFIPLESAYNFVSLSNAFYSVMLETSDAFSTNLVRQQKEVQEFVGRYANVYRWDQVHSAEFENFSSTKVMLVFVMFLIVLVASINVSSAIVMLEMERRKEIGILKSIGATPNGICFSFVIAGLSCGIGGILIGVPAGLILAVNINNIIMGIEKLVNFFLKLSYSAKGIANEAAFKLLDPAYYLQNIPVPIPVKQIILTICLKLI